MTKAELLNLLTVMREHFKAHPKGDCKILSRGDACICALCSLDNAIAVAEKIQDCPIQLKIDIRVAVTVPADFIELRLT